MKKKILLIAALSVVMNTSVYASNLSDWALEDYENLSRGGILTYDIVSGDYKAPITRREVSAILVKLYEQLTVTGIPDIEHSFKDTDDEYVKKAYAAGIVSGKSEDIFDPEGAVTRQEFAKMMLNTLSSVGLNFETDEALISETLDVYEDGTEVAQWAKDAMTVAMKTGVINGTSKDKISPKGNATREQAICMVSRIYNQFVKEKTIYDAPNVSAADPSREGDMNFTWHATKGASKYMVLVKDAASKLMEAFETSSTKATIYRDGYDAGLYTITLGAKDFKGIETYSNPFEFAMADQNYETIQYFFSDLTGKEARVFPTGMPFQNGEEASQYMVSVTVPVWKINAKGEKYSSKASLTINQALAEDVVNIFNLIYESPEKFPIKSVGGYYWRNTASGNLSQHSYGTCIDINPDENYYVRPDGTPIVGSYWKPYEDPYSIPEDGSVVSAFAQYDWEWGGNCWGEGYNKDYMHFTYLGK